MYLKVTTISGPSGDCECCGFYSGSGTEIYFNDELIWRKYFDGHMGGDCPEESVLNAVINAWNQFNIATIDAKFTEEKRHQWNKEKPGNGVARTPESWKEYKEQNLGFQKESFDNVKEACENLPHDEVRQVKMIALWIEEYTGEKIQVVEDNHYESDGNDDDGF
jgi:hypothetical protein